MQHAMQGKGSDGKGTDGIDGKGEGSEIKKCKSR
jgi:hypothetical protein